MSDEKKDFCRDGLCFASIHEEKDCLNFAAAGDGNYRYAYLCKHQGIGTTCDFKEKDHAKD